MRAPLALAIVVVVAAGLPRAAAQTSPQGSAAPGRPRIGLALGGGVARGLAHIGVIQWLEEHHIPIDRIAGTSAGGLVGGAYAIGLSPAELRTSIAAADWNALFQTDVPYALRDFRRKEDARRYPAPIEFGLRNGFRLPSRIGASEQVDLFLSRLTQRYFDIRTFDDLPIPFRCVATDLIAEEQVVLGDGALAEALRATMAVPGLFSPVLRDGRMLADGGLVNNVPADVVRAMEADIVIAVDVSGSTPLEPGYDSAFTVMSRTLDVVTDRNARQAMKAADFLVKPDVKDIEAMDWRRWAEIADRGYRAAASVPGLADLAVDDAAWAAYIDQRESRRVHDDPFPTMLSVSGVPPAEQARIGSQLVRHMGRRLDGFALSRDLTAITGSTLYDAVTYQLVRRPEGIELAVRATPKSHGPPFLRFTLDATNAGTTLLAVGVRGRLTAFDVAGEGSEVRLDSMVGTGFSLATELYHPVGGSPVFLAPHASVQWSDREAFLDTRRLEGYRTNRALFGADLGISLGRNSEWRIGYTYGHATTLGNTGEDATPQFTGPESMARMTFVHDGQDDAVVPSRGVRVEATLVRILKGVEPESATGADLRTGRRTIGEVVSSTFVPLGRRQRVMLAFSGGTSFNASTDSYYDFTLGGPSRLRAYQFGEFRGLNYLLGSVAYLRSIGRLPDFMGGQIVLDGALEVGSTFTELRSARMRTVVSAGLVLDTLLGPVDLSAGVSTDGHFRFYANVGRAFR